VLGDEIVEPLPDHVKVAGLEPRVVVHGRGEFGDGALPGTGCGVVERYHVRVRNNLVLLHATKQRHQKLLSQKASTASEDPE